MTITPSDVLGWFPVRKSTVQKLAFRDAVERFARHLGYETSIESDYRDCKNLIIGDPKQAKYLITAHYDTCATMPVSNRLYADNPLMYVLWQFVIAFSAVLIPLLSAALGAVIACIVYMQLHPFLNTNRMLGLAAIVFLVLFLVLYLASYLMIYNGPANPSNANDNTSGVMTVLEILRSLPESQRHKVCCVLFDRNEKGLGGSSAFYKKHRDTLDHQLVLNFSCVGDGDQIFLMPTGKLKKNTELIAPLYKCCGYFGQKSVLVLEKNTAIYPSDHKKFPYAVGISAFKKGKTGHYIDRIHTAKDTVLDITNVNLLRAAIVSMICGDAAQ